MPKVRRQNLPPALFAHLLDRVHRRHVSTAQLGLLADWLESEPEVPTGRWYKRFPEMTVCGDGEFITTFLTPDQSAEGHAVD